MGRARVHKLEGPFKGLDSNLGRARVHKLEGPFKGLERNLGRARAHKLEGPFKGLERNLGRARVHKLEDPFKGLDSNLGRARVHKLEGPCECKLEGPKGLGRARPECINWKVPLGNWRCDTKQLDPKPMYSKALNGSSHTRFRRNSLELTMVCFFCYGVLRELHVQGSKPWFWIWGAAII